MLGRPDHPTPQLHFEPVPIEGTGVNYRPVFHVAESCARLTPCGPKRATSQCLAGRSETDLRQAGLIPCLDDLPQGVCVATQLFCFMDESIAIIFCNLPGNQLC